MNVYDFDKTIYDGDSTVDFWKWCLKRYPKTRRDLLAQGLWGIGFGLKLIPKTRFKENFYRFLARLPDTEAAVEIFWKEHKCKIKKWYLETKRPDDVIISASPEFLLTPICSELGVERMMASRVDPATGVYNGTNCHGEEKVRRYRAKFGPAQIHEFYSDSYSDTPLAKLAFDPILVKGNEFEPWSEKELAKK